MSLLLHGDCLEHMKSIDDDSVDLIFCDLPYGQTSCKWDTIIPWEPFWNEIMRIKKLNTPIFFTTTTKFGVELINNAPKKCHFRYDLVWVKSAPAGFLSAKKMPMRKHEMIYVFYEKLPLYDLSSHKHKFIKKETTSDKIQSKNYETELENKTDENGNYKIDNKNMYRGGKGKPLVINRNNPNGWESPLPTSVVKEPEPEPEPELIYGENANWGKKHYTSKERASSVYEPPLPVSVVKEPEPKGKSRHGAKQSTCSYECYQDSKLVRGMDYAKSVGEEGIRKYEPPLPNSLLEIKSTRGKHSTEKPVALMEWIFKYYSKEGDVILDPTMGSGSTGVACKNMNRNFIGIEKDPEIYQIAVNRIQD